MASAGRPVQRRAAILVLEVDVRVSVEEQLGDVVVVLGAGVEQRRAALVGDGIHGRAVVQEVAADGHVTCGGRDDQGSPPVCVDLALQSEQISG